MNVNFKQTRSILNEVASYYAKNYICEDISNFYNGMDPEAYEDEYDEIESLKKRRAGKG